MKRRWGIIKIISTLTLLMMHKGKWGEKFNGTGKNSENISNNFSCVRKQKCPACWFKLKDTNFISFNNLSWPIAINKNKLGINISTTAIPHGRALATSSSSIIIQRKTLSTAWSRLFREWVCGGGLSADMLWRGCWQSYAKKLAHGCEGLLRWISSKN